MCQLSAGIATAYTHGPTTCGAMHSLSDVCHKNVQRTHTQAPTAVDKSKIQTASQAGRQTDREVSAVLWWSRHKAIDQQGKASVASIHPSIP
mmetsp:Transcript_36087/g.90022  ORF Transcript_36087/g.90022 Transcript_36087/m.90022 type:complete len:92 (+) Transcript_36087:155-430(+)